MSFKFSSSDRLSNLKGYEFGNLIKREHLKYNECYQFYQAGGVEKGGGNVAQDRKGGKEKENTKKRIKEQKGDPE